MYIGENHGKNKIGQARFELDKNGKAAYINTNLNPKFFGKGLGSIFIKLATKAYLAENPKIKEVFARILDRNAISKKVFARSGYVFRRNLYRNGKKISIFRFRKDLSWRFYL